MSYEKKLSEAVECIKAYNTQLAESETKIDIDVFEKRLRKIGAIDDTAFNLVSFEDLEECGLPRLLSRRVAAIFRTVDKSTEKPLYIKESHAKAMPIKQLVEMYDPKEPDNSVGKVLSDKSKNQPFIVFGDDGKVNVAASVTLLEELREGHPAREFYTVEGIPCSIYAVGDRPDKLADVNPLFPGEALRPDGTCSQTGRSWSGVGKEVRQIIFLARVAAEVLVNTTNDAHNIMDLAVTDNSLAKIRQRFPQAVLKLKELRDAGNEPSLRIPIGRSSDSRSNDPFLRHKKF